MVADLKQPADLGDLLPLCWSRMVTLLCAVKAGDFQWVQIPRGDGSLQPEAVGAMEEVTNPSKPLM